MAFRDLEHADLAGKRTLVVRFGRRFARWQFALSLMLALALSPVLFLRGYSAAVFLPWLLIPLGWRDCVHRLESVQDTLLHFLHAGVPDSVPVVRG